jgi:hypothetical protein
MLLMESMFSEESIMTTQGGGLVLGIQLDDVALYFGIDRNPLPEYGRFSVYLSHPNYAGILSAVLFASANGRYLHVTTYSEFTPASEGVVKEVTVSKDANPVSVIVERHHKPSGESRS